MKPDLVFTLEHAGWPALLVDGAGVIYRANQAAIKTFGPALEGSSPRLLAVWSPENSLTAEQFLAQWERSPTPTVSAKFRAKGGNTLAETVSVCSFSREEQKYFVLQLLPEKTSSSAEPRSHSVE
ncbi:MAG TPA: hypothetical protein VHI52_16370, partial [Verrucomicrobiae bacterium]|nr:hypothetical protein [Verrucomicrobiae bacterium]